MPLDIPLTVKELFSVEHFDSVKDLIAILATEYKDLVFEGACSSVASRYQHGGSLGPLISFWSVVIDFSLSLASGLKYDFILEIYEAIFPSCARSLGF